ncbi:raffinose/stachyose/melibiose transport system substrate-binding protein [Paenibacillus sp. UNCCL117]|uniref:extracellular solute-binding protein n=1 Tax=unclassified Paenibacillus TaxID=185978 RepID=UPI0008871669|nr:MULTISPECIES: extracellular solute-binding protein [unclassified Paenibacillus]SDE64742.1 raffinose/stachyose/melibiose transport system substrate-binding protein [Paenibacillus sp. cl123]SFW70532.1 raffinose/stachyose/melibiose transport system substrate-binding protein [Paenibacillus sp. UNCCL117]
MKKKTALQAVLASTLAVGLTACGTGGSGGGESPAPAAGTTPAAGGTQEKKAETITITFQNIYPDPTDPKNGMLKKIVADYQAKNPNIKIELDSLNTDQQKLKLKTQAASKEVPDITIVNPAAQMKPFVDAGLFAPLNDMVAQNGLKDTFQSGILDWYTFNNNIYALPDGNNIGVVYYNKELFQQAGVEVPKTFEEMVEVVKKLKAKGIQPMAIGEKDSWTGSFLFMNVLLRTNGGPGFLKDVADGKKTFLDPAFTEAVDSFQNLIQAGAFQEGATSFDYNAGENLFKTGKAAMYYMGSWATGGIETSSVNGKVGVFKFPTVNGKGNPDEFMLAPGSAFAVSANSKHLKETKDFLNYFMLNFPKEAFAVKGAVGIAQKVEGDFKAAGYSEMAMEVLGLFKQVKGGDLAFDNTMNPGTAQGHLTSIQNLFVQKKNSADVGKEHQTAYEANKK